jgi:beta-glucosidase-like glycosyl hydrolase
MVFVMMFIAHGNGLFAQKASSSMWVDSVFKTLTLEEKIGQLFMIRAHSNLGADHLNSVRSQIKKYHVGGICFFAGTPQKQAEWTSDFQKLSKVPLLISMDAEWGLSMRHKETALSFPHQLMLGAVPNVNDIEEMGYAIGKQLKAVGVNFSFSPVADVNNNAANPVIGDRSFGEDKDEVTKRAIAYMKVAHYPCHPS